MEGKKTTGADSREETLAQMVCVVSSESSDTWKNVRNDYGLAANRGAKGRVFLLYGWGLVEMGISLL